VRESDLVSPITSSNGNNTDLGKDNSSSNCGGNFLCALNSESNMSVVISNNNESLESSTLSSTSLLLNGHDLHNFVLDLSSKEEIDDLVFLDR